MLGVILVSLNTQKDLGVSEPEPCCSLITGDQPQFQSNQAMTVAVEESEAEHVGN